MKRQLLPSKRRVPRPIRTMLRRVHFVYRNVKTFDVFFEKRRSKSRRRNERLSAKRENAGNAKLKRPKRSGWKNETHEDASGKPKMQSARFSDKKSETSEELPGRRTARNVKKRERLESALVINVGKSAPDPAPEIAEIEIATAAAAEGGTAASEDGETAHVKAEKGTDLKKSRKASPRRSSRDSSGTHWQIFYVRASEMPNRSNQRWRLTKRLHRLPRRQNLHLPFSLSDESRPRTCQKAREYLRLPRPNPKTQPLNQRHQRRRRTSKIPTHQQKRRKTPRFLATSLRPRSHPRSPRRRFLEKSVVAVSPPLSEMHLLHVIQEPVLVIEQEMMSDASVIKIRTETVIVTATVRLNGHENVIVPVTPNETVNETVSVIARETATGIGREIAANPAGGIDGKGVDPGAESVVVHRRGGLRMRIITVQERLGLENVVLLDVEMIGTDGLGAARETERREAGAGVVSAAGHGLATIETGVIERIVERDRDLHASGLRERTEAGHAYAPNIENGADLLGEHAARSPTRLANVQRRLVTAGAGRALALLLHLSKTSSRYGKWARSRNVSRKPRPI